MAYSTTSFYQLTSSSLITLKYQYLDQINIFFNKYKHWKTSFCKPSLHQQAIEAVTIFPPIHDSSHLSFHGDNDLISHLYNHDHCFVTLNGQKENWGTTFKLFYIFVLTFLQVIVISLTHTSLIYEISIHIFSKESPVT